MEESVINIVANSSEIVKYVLTSEKCEKPFYVCDLGDIIEKYKKWVKYFPRIKPHYAVKCNNHPVLLKLLATLGIGFDCASKTELQKVLSIDGVHPSRIIYAHTIKPPSHITYAAAANVNLTTFDNECELYKLKKLYPDCRAVVRIKYDAKESVRSMGTKFGCDSRTEAPQLLQLAQKLGIDVVGVSFHVGTLCKTPCTYYGAIAAARKLFDVAKSFGFNFNLLDIGGGYPGEAGDSIAVFSNYINAALDEYFPDPSVQIISEPGTYFATSAFKLMCSVHSIKQAVGRDSEPEYFYYVSDGIYGSFGHVVSFNITKIPKPLKNHLDEKEYVSTIWGPTCDSDDKIASNILLPKLELGEWLEFTDCGAYSLTWATPFNGFDLPDVYCYVDHHNGSWLSKQKIFLEDTFVVHSL